MTIIISTNRAKIEAISNKVVTLKIGASCTVKENKRQVSIGDLKLGYLQKGKYRELTKEEVQYIKEL